MAHFYPFPGSCAIQVYSNHGYGGKVPPTDLKPGALEQKYLLTLAVTGEDQAGNEQKFKTLGLKRLGTFNSPHQGKTVKGEPTNNRLTLWIAGADFELDKEFTEHRTPRKRSSDAKKENPT